MTSFDRVSRMNEAFGNPAGNGKLIHLERLHKQCLNIADEMAELMIALGVDSAKARWAATFFKASCKIADYQDVDLQPDIEGVRDALCDIHVFAYGAHHIMGIDADLDMAVVVDAVMTRFIKDDADKAATIAMHAAKGVTDVYFEGEYPKMIMKSASDQPDAPKGKFLKSASYTAPKFL